jgi:hypothetical protein
MTVCIECGAALPPGLLGLNLIEPDPAQFPLSAARPAGFSYRLCSTCEASLTPVSRRALELRLISALEAGLLLEQLTARLQDETYRSEPNLRALAQAALAVHRGYQAEAAATVARLSALLLPLQALNAVAREALGNDWLASLVATLQAHKESLRESDEAIDGLLRRLGPSTD